MRALIAGVYEVPERKTARSALEMQAISARAALEDAGLTRADVDGDFEDVSPEVSPPRFRPIG